MADQSQPRFTLQLTLRDNYSIDRPLAMAVGLDQEVRISSRELGLAKCGLSMGDSVIDMLRTKVMRKDLFVMAAERLGALLAERMEDAEGWHDQSRVEPARKELGWQPFY